MIISNLALTLLLYSQSIDIINHDIQSTYQCAQLVNSGRYLNVDGSEKIDLRPLKSVNMLSIAVGFHPDMNG